MTGSGTLQLNIPYLREYLKGDNFSAFTGRLIANGISSEKEGSLFLLNDNTVNFKNSVVELAGNARMVQVKIQKDLHVLGVLELLIRMRLLLAKSTIGL